MTASEITTFGILKHAYPNRIIVFFKGKFYMI